MTKKVQQILKELKEMSKDLEYLRHESERLYKSCKDFDCVFDDLIKRIEENDWKIKNTHSAVKGNQKK